MDILDDTGVSKLSAKVFWSHFILIVTLDVQLFNYMSTNSH